MWWRGCARDTLFPVKNESRSKIHGHVVTRSALLTGATCSFIFERQTRAYILSPLPVCLSLHHDHDHDLFYLTPYYTLCSPPVISLRLFFITALPVSLIVMSANSTPSASPVHVQPLHNPSQAAHVVVPQAPLGNATNGPVNQAPGLGAKALLAKKMAKSMQVSIRLLLFEYLSTVSCRNPNYVSPTDNMMTPCTKKISAAKKKHFTKSAAFVSG